MRLTRAKITARNAEKKKETMVRLSRWIPNTPESIAEFEKQVVRIKKKYKVELIKNLEGMDNEF